MALFHSLDLKFERENKAWQRSSTIHTFWDLNPHPQKISEQYTRVLILFYLVISFFFFFGAGVQTKQLH